MFQTLYDESNRVLHMQVDTKRHDNSNHLSLVKITAKLLLLRFQLAHFNVTRIGFDQRLFDLLLQVSYLMM